jgi:hypothetical protein
LILRVVGSQLICETSTASWANGHQIECVITPYPDITGFEYTLNSYTAGGTLRGFMKVLNNGPRKFQFAFDIEGSIPGGSSPADSNGFSVGFQALGGCDRGMSLWYTTLSAIDIHANTDAGSQITWGAVPFNLGTVAANNGMDFLMANGGLLRSVGVGSGIDANLNQLCWSGYFQICQSGINNQFLRFGGANTAGAGITNCFDIQLNTNTMSAHRTATCPDISGGLCVVGPNVTTPASSGAAGLPGMIVRDATYLYVCVATNTWVRSALTGGW